MNQRSAVAIGIPTTTPAPTIANARRRRKSRTRRRVPPSASALVEHIRASREPLEQTLRRVLREELPAKLKRAANE
jgi:hypothetical protein